MPDNDIGFSQQGIKFSYRKFLSDSAAGYIIILIAIASFYFPIFGQAFLNIPLDDSPIAKIAQMSDRLKIFLFILLFLLATPLGMAVNSSSWIFLGRLRSLANDALWYQESIEKSSKVKNLIPYFLAFFIDNTKKSFQFDMLKSFYHFDKNNFLQYSDLIEETLHIYHPDIKESISHIQGFYIFFRNIAFLLAIYIGYVIIYFLIKHNSPIGLGTFFVLIIFFIFILINFLENIIYYYLSILLIGYILCQGKRESCDSLIEIDHFINFIAKPKSDDPQL